MRRLLRRSAHKAEFSSAGRREVTRARTQRTQPRTARRVDALRPLVPRGRVEAFLVVHHHDLFPTRCSWTCSPRGGRPSVPAGTVAPVMVLQASRGSRSCRRTGVGRPGQLEGGLRSRPRQGGPRLLGPHLLAHAAARFGPSRAHRRRGASGDRGHRGREGHGPSGARLDDRRRRRDPGHRFPTDRRDPARAPSSSTPWSATRCVVSTRVGTCSTGRAPARCRLAH